MKHATKHLTAVAIVGALLCSGCTTQADSSPKQSPTSSQSRSQKPTPKSGWEDGPPILPLEAQRNTQEGAIATGKYFIEAHDYAIQSGNTRPMQQVLAKEGSAQETFTEIETKLKADGKWTGKKASVSPDVAHPKEGDIFYTQFKVSFPTYTSIKEPEDRISGGIFLYGINLIYRDNMWEVRDFRSQRLEESLRENAQK